MTTLPTLTRLDENALLVQWTDEKGDNMEMILTVGNVFSFLIGVQRHDFELEELFAVKSKDQLLIIKYVNADKIEIAPPRGCTKVLSLTGLSLLGQFVSMNSLKRIV